MTTTNFSSIIAREGADFKRIDDMTAPLFNDDQLRVVQEGVHHMFHVVRDIVAPREPGARFPQKEILERLNKMEEEKWQKIRIGILDSKIHDYHEGNFTEEENRMPVKIMYDMMLIMSNLKACIEVKLQEYYDTEIRLRNEMRELHSTLAETQAELTDVRWNYKKDKATLNTIQSSIKHLEQVSSEKTEKITELQRQENVQLWQKEKERTLAKAKERETELTAQVEKLTREKNALQKKFETADNQLKLQKIKHEVISSRTNSTLGASPEEDSKGPTPSGENNKGPIPSGATSEELTKAKQHIYVLEKDLRSIENELFNQQKYMIGLLKGLKDDYWSTWDPILTEEQLPLPTTRQGRQLGLRLNNIFQAASGGKLGAIRADLPDHYLATDSDINRVSVKKLSSAYGVKLSPLPVPKDTPPPKDTSVPEENGDTSNPANNRRRSTLLPEGTLLGYTRAGRRRSSVLPNEHPELVNPRTGLVNMIAVMKFFPYMVKEYVAEQWEHFKAYDTNGDGDLDLTEMLNAMKNTIGSEFTAAQVKDAMMEVDIDGSQTIDFFEYLSIAHLILEKKGRSEVFRSKIAREEGRHVSKTCVVQ